MVYNLFDWLTSSNVIMTFATVAGALASVVLAGVTGWTLYVLRHYAKDTKRMAETGLEQLEASQAPFLALTMKGIQPKDGVVEWFYELENQGSGPALNVFGFWKCDGSDEENPLFGVTSIGKGHAISIKALSRIYKSRFTYKSLSEKTYTSETDNLLNIKFLPPKS